MFDTATYALLEGVASGVILTGDDDTILFANHAAHALAGCDDLSQHRFLNLFQPQCYFRLEQAADGVDIKLKRFDGTLTWVHLTQVPLRMGSDLLHMMTLVDISERKRLAETLRQSERHYAQLLDSVTDVISLHDLDSTFLYVTPSSRFTSGWLPEEMVGTVGNDMIHPDDRLRVQQATAEAFANGQPSYNEWRCRRRDGSYVWLETISRLLLDENGEPYRIVSASRNITARLETEAALRASEQRYRALFESCPDAIMVLDSETGTILDCNPAASTVNGYTRAEMIGQPINLLNAPDSLTDQGYIETLRQAGRLQFEVTHRRKDGSLVPLEVVTTLAMLGDREVVIGFDRDISARKAADEALRQSEARYRAVIEDQTEFICRFLADERWTITFVNEAYCRNYQRTRDELIGGSVFDVLPPEEHARARAHLRLLSSENPTAVWEHSVQAVDGSVRWNQWRDRALFDSQGAILEYQTIGHDITERKRAEAALLEQERLRSALQHEQALSQVKNKVMSTIAHEFRTPLAIISSATQMLERYSDRLSAEGRDSRLRQIRVMVWHLTEMLEDMALVVRGQLRRIEFKSQPVDLHALCTRLLEDFGSTLGAEHLLHFTMDGSPEAYTILADERLLRRIVMNLLSNAIKYSQPGTNIWLALRAEASAVALSVRDEGIGIEGKNIEQIFEPFFRGSDHGEINGIGLGLTIVKECVELHGGTIAVESTPGKGTAFTVLLPGQQSATGQTVQAG